jgi:HAE1 family hydrophobic/amphiphilic exporter-1
MIVDTPMYAPVGQIVPISAVCRLDRTTAPQQINHIETQRSVKLSIRPPEGVSLPEVMDTLENDIVGAMRGEGYGEQKMTIPPNVTVSLAGNADKLRDTWDSLKWLLCLSLLVVYLLMAGLFESFAYPLVIVLTVPFAVVGGFVGLALINWWTWSNASMAIQQLDMLTILGFVVLLGIVVNNGILIVHQTLNFIQYGVEPSKAIVDSVRTRIRPIFMTVMTTFFGQLLLVVRPGSGAELYRGLGAVVLGGLLFSTLFTLVVVPAMLSLFIGAKVHVSRILFGRGTTGSLTGVAVGAGEAGADIDVATVLTARAEATRV